MEKRSGASIIEVPRQIQFCVCLGRLRMPKTRLPHQNIRNFRADGAEGLCNGRPKYLSDETQNIGQRNERNKHLPECRTGKMELYNQAESITEIVKVILARLHILTPKLLVWGRRKIYKYRTQPPGGRLPTCCETCN